MQYEKFFNNMDQPEMLMSIRSILEADIEDELYKLDLEINRIFNQTQD